MANADKKFDQYFHEKLVNHEVKPSKLAWERLDSQLGKKGNAGYFPFMRIAAAIILIMGIGYIFWQVSRSEVAEKQVAEIIQIPVQEEVLDNKPKSQIGQERTNGDQDGFVNTEKTPSVKNQESTSKKPQTIKKPDTESPKSLLADNTEQVERNQEQLIGIPELDLPELKLDEALALNEPVGQVEEEIVEYKITIKSKGLKDEPAKQGLLEGIEDKVDKIGGFLNKVEQGFADLQDAKENLFASNVPRRERSK